MKLNDKDFEDLEVEDLESIKKRVEKKKQRRSRKGEPQGFRIPPALIPVIVVLVIILIIFSVNFGKDSLEGLAGIKVDSDIDGYFGGLGSDEAGIILNDEYLTETKAVIDNGNVYLPYEFVKSELNDWFYHDENEGLVLYTTPEGTDRIEEGNEAKKAGGAFCLSVQLVNKYTDMEYLDKTGEKVPYVVIRNTWGAYTGASVVKKTGLYMEADKKSGIIAAVNKGSKVRVLNAGNEWTKIGTEEGLIGYVKNKSLGDYADTEDAAPGNVAEMEFPVTTYNEKVILGWHQIMNKTANGGVGDALINAPNINVIAPTWYSLTDTQGGFNDNSSEEYVKTAHNAGRQVWAVVDNFNTEGFDIDDGTFEMLSHTTSRQVLIENMINSTVSCGADGINVDFEQLSGESEEHFAQFLKELSIACHNAGLVVSVDNYVPKAYSQHYHRDVQGKVCDFCIIMGYDEYNGASTEAGPVASVGFVEEGIDRTLEEVAPSRVINGLPFYTRIWETQNGTVKSTQALGMGEAKGVLRDHGVTPEWDDTAGCNYGEYESGGSLWRMWLEDSESVAAKLSIMDSKGLAGAAFWKLGMEESAVWDEIAAYASRPAGSVNVSVEEASE